MLTNESLLNSKWFEVKAQIKKVWGKLTDDELEKTKGEKSAIGKLIKQKYNKDKDDYSSKLSGIFSRAEESKEQNADLAKTDLKF